MGRPWVTHLKIGNPCLISTHWVNYKYLFSNQMLSYKKHIAWKLVYFCIDSYKQLSNFEDASRIIESFLINPLFWKFSLIFHGLLLWLQKKIEMKIFLNWSQESSEKNSWVPIAMLWFHGVELFEWTIELWQILNLKFGEKLRVSVRLYFYYVYKKIFNFFKINK